MTNITILHRAEVFKILVVDVLGIGMILIMPSLSHLLPIPFYLLDPMRFSVLIILFSTNKNNGLILAALLPFISYISTGHPIFPKNILISVELITNIVLLQVIMRKVKYFSAVVIISIILSKVFYYLMKYGMVKMLWISGDIISTPITIQLLSVLIISVSTSYIFGKRNNDYEDRVLF
jgi:hypothetical protein